jgi:hypothetical protein
VENVEKGVGGYMWREGGNMWRNVKGRMGGLGDCGERKNGWVRRLLNIDRVEICGGGWILWIYAEELGGMWEIGWGWVEYIFKRKK